MNQTVDDKKLGNTKILQDCCSVLDNQATLWYKNWDNTKRVQCKVCKASWNKDVD